MKIETLGTKNLDTKKWNDLVKKARNGTVFNTVEWAKLWELSSSSRINMKALFLVLSEKDDFTASMPIIEIRKLGFKSYYSMPYGTYGGVLFNPKLIGVKTFGGEPKFEGFKN